MPKKFENFNNPRKKALAGMKQSISTELWEKFRLFDPIKRKKLLNMRCHIILQLIF